MPVIPEKIDEIPARFPRSYPKIGHKRVPKLRIKKTEAQTPPGAATQAVHIVPTRSRTTGNRRQNRNRTQCSQHQTKRMGSRSLQE